MIKTIDGITYNTDSAKSILYTTKGDDLGELDYYKEILYARKKDGALFLYVKGGANTIWGKHGGEDIIPLDIIEAYTWAYCGKEIWLTKMREEWGRQI